ncbi:MAG: hypothetical protein GX654_15940 [Desulfatiglans sp.]|nr:hypothetical protein [Desulfatiglans sp.]
MFIQIQPDGTIMDGHHRIHILRKRGVDVDSAFQIIEKARKRPVPDTKEQRTWVEQYATGLKTAGSLKVAEKAEQYKTTAGFGHNANADNIVKR